MDPGLLVSVKMLPRRDTKGASQTPAAAPPPPPRNRPTRPGTPAAGGKTAETLKPAQKKALAEQGWMDISSKLVSAWRKRFQAAALAQKKAEEESGIVPEDAKPKLPPDFTLNTGAKVIASYHLRWPDEAPAGLAGKKLSPLEIYYIYAEEVNKPKKAIGFYARQAQVRLSDARPLDNAAWFDALRVVPQTDRRRSIDVFVSRPGNQATDLMRDDMEADLVIEVLTIEIKDPAGRESSCEAEMTNVEIRMTKK